MNALGFKEACQVVRLHYGADTDTPRKLAQLFEHDGTKREGIFAEARRILALRERLGTTEGACELCGRVGPAPHVAARTSVQLQTDTAQRLHRGWRRWRIAAPTLCRHCERVARSEIALYRELLELYGLIRTLTRSEPHDVTNHG